MFIKIARDFAGSNERDAAGKTREICWVAAEEPDKVEALWSTLL